MTVGVLGVSGVPVGSLCWFWFVGLFAAGGGWCDLMSGRSWRLGGVLFVRLKAPGT